MKNCHSKFKFLYEMDLFGKTPELYYKGKSKKTSKFGFILTIIYILLYIAFLVYKLLRMVKRTDVTFYDTYAYKGFPSIKLTNEEFYGGFSMGYIVDETLYYPVAAFVSGVKKNGIWDYAITYLEVEICQLEKFGSKYREIFKNQPLKNLYCLKNVNFTLEGYSNLDRFSFINVQVHPCINFTRDGRKCKNKTEIQKFFASNTIEFKMQDNLLTPEIYETPVEPQEKDINAPVYLQIYQRIFSHIQIVIIETDEDLTGLTFFGKNRVEKYPKYENSMLIAAPPSENILETGGPVSDVILQLSANVLTQKRKYTTIVEVLGDVGGLMELLWTFLNIIASFISEILYEKSLINNLFSFDIDKKVIVLKKKNKNNIDLKNNKTIDIFKIKSIEELKKSNIELFPKEQYIKKATNSKIKKKRKKRISTIKPNVSLKNSDETKSIEKIKNNEINIISPKNSNCDITNFVKSEDLIKEKEPEKNKEKENIIEKIKINNCCFCFLNKNKNIQKILFEEGAKIIIEKLDIMNLFNKLYTVEKIKENLNIEGKLIEMPEKCRQILDNFP